MKGFTLIEMVLSIACIGLLFGISLPVYLRFTAQSDLQSSTSQIVGTLRRACVYARNGKADNTWGVHLTSTTITLFEGATYATRDTTSDEVISTSGSTTLTGLTDVVYSKLYGLPNTTGTITVSSSEGTNAIVIGGKNVVTY